MAPTKIMFIRHGEKPETPSDRGIDPDNPDGPSDPLSLTAEGWLRAKKLVGFFLEPHTPGIAAPTRIFACKSDNESKRPVQTVSLLANQLFETDAARAANFITTFTRDQTKEAAKAVSESDGVCLIAWEHKRIPIPGDAGVPGLMKWFTHVPTSPNHWSGHRFDMVWVLDAHPIAWAFSQIPQMLLAGDTDKPMKDKPLI